MMLEHILPPLLLIDLFEMNVYCFLILFNLSVRLRVNRNVHNLLTHSPGTIIEFDLLAKLAIENLIFAFKANA